MKVNFTRATDSLLFTADDPRTISPNVTLRNSIASKTHQGQIQKVTKRVCECFFFAKNGAIWWRLSKQKVFSYSNTCIYKTSCQSFKAEKQQN